MSNIGGKQEGGKEGRESGRKKEGFI